MRNTGRHNTGYTDKDGWCFIGPDGTLAAGISSRDVKRYLARQAKKKKAQPVTDAGRALGTSTTPQITPQRQSESLQDTTP
jgi:hypothetical protein